MLPDTCPHEVVVLGALWDIEETQTSPVGGGLKKNSRSPSAAASPEGKPQASSFTSPKDEVSPPPTGLHAPSFPQVHADSGLMDLRGT